MKEESKLLELKPENYYCIHCAFEDEVYREAERMVWLQVTGKALPVCKWHYDRMQQDDERFFQFNPN